MSLTVGDFARVVELLDDMFKDTQHDSHSILGL